MLGRKGVSVTQYGYNSLKTKCLNHFSVTPEKNIKRDRNQQLERWTIKKLEITQR